jgi:hypothetical protein
MSEEHSRRTFLTAGLVASVASVARPSTAGALLDVDHRRLVSRADLNDEKPVAKSEEGLPVGNGRMGSLLWTTPPVIKFQINRVDVYGNNSYCTSFPERNTDYAWRPGLVVADISSSCYHPDGLSGLDCSAALDLTVDYQSAGGFNIPRHISFNVGGAYSCQ